MNRRLLAALLAATALTAAVEGPPVVPLSRTHLGQVGGATVPNTVTVTVTAESLVIVSAATRRNSVATNALACADNSGDGRSWTQIVDGALLNTNGMRVALFKKRFAAGGTPTITVSSTSTTSIGIEAEEFLGASDDTSNFSPGSGAALSTVGDPSCTLPTAPDIGSIVLGSFGSNGSNALTLPSGMTLINTQGINGGQISTCFRQSTSTTAAWTSSNAESVGLLLEIKQATPGGGGGGAVPTFVAASTIVGNGATASTAVSPTYPSTTILGNDIAILALHGDNHSAMAVPGGWTAAGAQEDTTGSISARLWWQRCAGGESGAVACTRGTGATGEWFGGTIAVYRGCVASGTPFEGYSAAQNTTTTVNGPAITTTGPNRLAVHIYCIGDDTVSTPPAGYTEDFEAFEQSGNDGCQAGESQAVASATTIGAVTRTIGVANPSVGFGLALIPA